MFEKFNENIKIQGTEKNNILDLLSCYRTTLMGIAMLSVFIVIC